MSDKLGFPLPCINKRNQINRLLVHCHYLMPNWPLWLNLLNSMWCRWCYSKHLWGVVFLRW